MRNFTKLHILNSFNLLMNEYPFEKITIDMILKHSEISKSTFYRYYMDKYEVMNYSYVIFVEKIFKFHLCHSLKELFVMLLKNAVTNSTRIKNAYAYNGMNSFTSFLYDYSCTKFDIFIQETRNTKITAEEKLRISLFCHGFIWVIKDYVDNKIDLPIDTIAEILYKSLPPTIQNLWYEQEKGIPAIQHPQEIP